MLVYKKTPRKEDLMKHHHLEFKNLVDDAKSRIQEISVEDLYQLIESNHDFVLIDVREEDEWSQGRLPSAIHISKGIIERDIANTIPNTETEIILYCSGGFRSALAADNLQEMGYTNVKSMAGGSKTWQNSGLPIVKE